MNFITTYRAERIKEASITLDHLTLDLCDALGSLRRDCKSDFHIRQIDRMLVMLNKPVTDVSKYFSKFYTFALTYRSLDDLFTDKYKPLVQKKIRSILRQTAKLIDDNRLNKEIQSITS